MDINLSGTMTTFVRETKFITINSGYQLLAEIMKFSIERKSGYRRIRRFNGPFVLTKNINLYLAIVLQA